MQTILEDYFDFSDAAEIRIRGHRIWLHHILLSHRDQKQSFESICEDYSTLSKDEVLACLLYYYRNQSEMDAYLDKLQLELQERREVNVREQGNWLARLRARSKGAGQAAAS